MNRRLFGLSVLFIFAGVILSGCSVPSSNPAESTITPSVENQSEVEEYQIVTLLSPDAIPSIDSPTFYAVEDANQEYEPDELVIGIELNGESKAYPIDLLSRHEIVNDELQGKPIAVTW
jgi:hypothetical protein